MFILKKLITLILILLTPAVFAQTSGNKIEVITSYDILYNIANDLTKGTKIQITKLEADKVVDAAKNANMILSLSYRGDDIVNKKAKEINKNIIEVDLTKKIYTFNSYLGKELKKGDEVLYIWQDVNALRGFYKEISNALLELKIDKNEKDIISKKAELIINELSMAKLENTESIYINAVAPTAILLSPNLKYFTKALYFETIILNNIKNLEGRISKVPKEYSTPVVLSDKPVDNKTQEIIKKAGSILIILPQSAENPSKALIEAMKKAVDFVSKKTKK